MPSQKTDAGKLPLKQRGALLGPSGVVGGLRDVTDTTRAVSGGGKRTGFQPRKAPGRFTNGALGGRQGRRGKTY